MKTFSEKYRKAREAWTGRVEVEKGTWTKMLTENDNLREESLYKDQRIEALVEMLRKAEDKLETVREETYRNVAAGITRLERENGDLKVKLRQAEYFNISAPGLILKIRRMIRTWMEENGLDPDEWGDTSSTQRSGSTAPQGEGFPREECGHG